MTGIKTHPITLIAVMIVLFISSCMSAKKGAEGAATSSSQTEITQDAFGDMVELSDVEETIPEPNGYFYYVESLMLKKKGHADKAVQYLKEAMQRDPESSYLQKELANLYLRTDDPKSALSLVENVLKKEPENLETLILYGRLKHALKDMEAAKKIYERILDKDPSQKDIYMFLGNIYLDENDADNASRIYRRMIDRFPDAYVAYFYLGKIYVIQGRLSEAEKAFKKTLELEPDLEEPRFELALLYERQGKSEKVIRFYKEILSAEPDNIRANIGLGLYYHKKGRLKESEPIFRQLGIRSRSEADVMRLVAQQYIEQKDFKNAVVLLEGMLKGAPDSSELHYIIGVAYEGVNNVDKTISHLKKVTPDSRFFQNAAAHISFLYQQQGDIEKGIRFLTDIIKKVPNNPDFMIYLASFYEDIEEFEKAENILLDGLDALPENIRLYFRLGVVYDKWGRKRDSIEIMRKVIALDPKDANALNYLGYTYADLGENLDEAEQLIRDALKYKPDDGYIMDSLGWVYYKKGLYDKALEILEKSVKLVSDDPTIFEHIGDVYLMVGEKKKALEFFERSLLKRQKGDNSELEEKIRQLRREGVRP
ncbi:MAG: hypothetical protein BWK80_61115 [Desulfobacteraceae bacterium IS3]|nr:MAG: hypothetical protein BWK80_61115 [Desulfobacteraceae bacterium IS3]